MPTAAISSSIEVAPNPFASTAASAASRRRSRALPVFGEGMSSMARLYQRYSRPACDRDHRPPAAPLMQAWCAAPRSSASRRRRASVSSPPFTPRPRQEGDMDSYRSSLPQLGDRRIFLTDGGIETTLIYHDGFDLPFFAAFPLLKSAEGREAFASYYGRLRGDRGRQRDRASSSRARPGAPTPTGARSSAIGRGRARRHQPRRDRPDGRASPATSRRRQSPMRDQRLHRSARRRLRPRHG